MFKQPTSLEKSWGIHKQAAWRLLKLITVSNAYLLYLTNSPSFINFYQFIAERRHLIAKVLAQPIGNKAGKLRNPQEPEPKQFVTPIMGDKEIETYSSYHTHILSMVDTLYRQAHRNSEKKSIRLTAASFPWFLRSIDKCDINVLHQKNDLLIQFNGINYSRISSFTILDNDMEKECLAILHTKASEIPKILDIVENLYQEFKNPTFTLGKKIEILKKMVWHLSHAMPCERGSAAITEIILEALLNSINIQYIPSDDFPPDLAAIFTETPQKFSESFIINTNCNFKSPIFEAISQINNFIESLDEKKVKRRKQEEELDEETLKNTAEKIINLLSGKLATITNFSNEDKLIIKNSSLAEILKNNQIDLAEVFQMNEEPSNSLKIP